MKGGLSASIIALLFLVSITTVTAAYFPQPDSYFIFRKATCDTNGTIIANITHSGKSVAFKDITMTIKGDKMPEQPFIGEWYRGNYPSANYEYPIANATGHDYTSTSQLRFKSLPRIYTAGNYEVDISWPSSSLYYDNIKFAVSCPGAVCSTTNDCIAQQACDTGVCKWLECSDQEYASGHICVKRCDDKNECTKDHYFDGRCIYTEIDDCAVSEEGNAVITPQKSNIVSRFWQWLRTIF